MIYYFNDENDYENFFGNKIIKSIFLVSTLNMQISKHLNIFPAALLTMQTHMRNL